MEEKIVDITYWFDGENLVGDIDKEFLKANNLKAISYGYMRENNLGISLKFKVSPTFNLVSHAIDDALKNLLQFSRVIYLKINPKDKTIIIRPNATIPFELLKSYSVIDTKFKESKNIIELFSFSMVEHSMDFWGRFATTDFLLFAEISDISKQFLAIQTMMEGNMDLEKVNHLSMSPEPLNYQLFCFPSCGEDNMERYIKTDNNGYNLDGDFWERDWVRDEFKRGTTGGGKFKWK